MEKQTVRKFETIYSFIVVRSNEIKENIENSIKKQNIPISEQILDQTFIKYFDFLSKYPIFTNLGFFSEHFVELLQKTSEKNDFLVEKYEINLEKSVKNQLKICTFNKKNNEYQNVTKKEIKKIYTFFLSFLNKFALKYTKDQITAWNQWLKTENTFFQIQEIQTWILNTAPSILYKTLYFLQKEGFTTQPRHIFNHTLAITPLATIKSKEDIQLSLFEESNNEQGIIQLLKKSLTSQTQSYDFTQLKDIPNFNPEQYINGLQKFGSKTGISLFLFLLKEGHLQIRNNNNFTNTLIFKGGLTEIAKKINITSRKAITDIGDILYFLSKVDLKQGQILMLNRSKKHLIITLSPLLIPEQAKKLFPEAFPDLPNENKQIIPLPFPEQLPEPMGKQARGTEDRFLLFTISEARKHIKDLKDGGFVFFDSTWNKILKEAGIKKSKTRRDLISFFKEMHYFDFSTGEWIFGEKYKHIQSYMEKMVKKDDGGDD